MTELGQMPGDARKRAAESDAVSFQIGGTTFVPEGSSPTVPRIARWVTDIQEGMVVATICHDGSAGECLTFLDEYRDSYKVFIAEGGQVVILADAPDPPARDWLVPATQMEALRESLVAPRKTGLYDAVRAVLDSAREVEHE